MRRASAVLVVVAVTVLCGPARATALDQTWTQIATGTTGGVSGAAPGDSGWVIVRDNKLAGQNRVALLSDSGVVTPLSWPGTPPQDLESLAALPDTPQQYATLTSTGVGSVFSIDGSTVTVISAFRVPKGTRNIESFALARLGSATVAVWATRGSTTAAAKVFAATFMPTTSTFGPVATARVTVPYPTTNVREVSDLGIVGSELIGSSASDPGASGPFESALYDLGSVSVASGRAALTMRTPLSLGVYTGHKVEGIACRAGVGMLGSDDEKQGGWARTESFCG